MIRISPRVYVFSIARYARAAINKSHGNVKRFATRFPTIPSAFFRRVSGKKWPNEIFSTRELVREPRYRNKPTSQLLMAPRLRLFDELFVRHRCTNCGTLYSTWLGWIVNFLVDTVIINFSLSRWFDQFRTVWRHRTEKFIYESVIGLGEDNCSNVTR